MRHLRGSCLCFCWMPSVTSPKLHGQSRSVSAAAKKLHSMVSAWENSCEIITCGRTLTFLQERLSLDPSPTLRSTLRVFLPLFMFTDVAHCTTTEIDCNWQQPQLSYGLHEKGKSINGTRTSLHRVPFSRRTGPPFCHERRNHAGTMKSGTIWRLPIFGETQSSARDSWL